MTAALAIRCQNPTCRFVLGSFRTETDKLTKARDVRMIVERDEGIAYLQCPRCETVRIWSLERRSDEQKAA